MGYWIHSWQLNEVVMRLEGQPDRTLQEYGEAYPTVTYPNQTAVKAYCVYCDFNMPIVYWPNNHRVSDIGPDINHRDAEGNLYTCPSLPDPDPNLVWVDDEGNWLAADQAPAEAKTQLKKQ